MTQRLTEIDVDEISLVGKPANRRKFTLLKQEDGLMSDTEKLMDELQKLTPEERAGLVEKLAPESEEAWRERVLKAIEGSEDEEVLKDDRAITVLAEEVKKANAEIAELRKAQQAAEAAVQKEKEAARRKQYIEKASTYSKLPGVVADDFGEILMKCEAALTEDEAKKLNEVLKAAAEGLPTDLMAERGSGAEGESDIVKQVETLVRKEMEADPKLTKAQAEARVYKKEPGLLDRVLAVEAEAEEE